jgi:proteic killer suppression protein
MIVSFGSKDTEHIWLVNPVKGLPSDIQAVARRKLRMINNAANIQDLTIPPANRLEKRSGRGKDFYSIWVNNQCRIVFKWQSGNAIQVELIDYH